MLPTHQQVIHYNGTAPNIDGLRVRCFAEALRSHVDHRSALLVEPAGILITAEAITEPEIDYFYGFEVRLVAEKNIV